jgi:hypothetical protein
LVCSFCEAMAGSMSVTSTAVLLAKVAVVDSGKIGRSAAYSRYNNGPRTLPLGTHTGESSVYSVSTFTCDCYAYRSLGQENNSEEETVLTCIGVQHAILCRTLERCLKILQKSTASFQELHLSFA